MSDPLGPRNSETPSLTEILPPISSKIHLLRSGFLLPALATAIVCVLFFTTLDSLVLQSVDVTTHKLASRLNAAAVIQYIRVFGAYLLFMLFCVIFFYARTDRPLWIYAIPAAICWLMLETSAVNGFIFVFRRLLWDSLLAGYAGADGSFVRSFAGYFVQAGLMEELIKAVPALLGAGLTLAGVRLATQMPGRSYELLRVRAPLDGLLIGASAGVMFTYLETVFHYVPDSGEAILSRTGSAAIEAVTMWTLLLARLIHSVAGHIGWAGISGYFVGLAVIRPKRWALILAVGWLFPALLHGLWDAVQGAEASYLISIASVVMFLACLMKARQLQRILFPAVDED